MQIKKMLEQFTRANLTLKEKIKQLKEENAKLQEVRNAGATPNTPSVSKIPTLNRAQTSVPSQTSGESPPLKRRVKEEAEKSGNFSISEVKGLFKEMFDEIQNEVTCMYVEIKRRFDGLEHRVLAIESTPKDIRSSGAGPVKLKPYSRTPTVETSKVTGEDPINKHGTT